jgi:uncharacterized membrane protein YhiD involved in acid resistance
MLDTLLDQSFYEFPSFKVALFSLLLAFVLSTVVAFTYKFTYKGLSYSGTFFQAMVLSSIATATVIMAVGNNVAVGFGIIGAIAIIRFRTRVNEPRNIIFIFASIGVGIASGVYGYAIAVAGTIIFCSVAFMLYFSAHGSTNLFLYALNFTINQREVNAEVLDFLEKNCSSYYLMSMSENKTNNERYEYQITIRDKIDQKVFYRDFSQIEGVLNVRLLRKNNLDRL